MNIKYISFVVAFILFSFTANCQSKVGTVNINDILIKLPELAEVENAVITYKAELEKTLNEKVTTYKNKVELFKQNSDSYSDVMKKYHAGIRGRDKTKKETDKGQASQYIKQTILNK